MWPFSRAEKRASLISIGDPVLAEFFGVGAANYSGESVSETKALGLSAVYRAVNLIAGTIASLPMPTLRTVEDRREPVGSFLDTPAGPDRQTPFEWKETLLLHLLLNGNAFLLHVYGGAGQLVGLEPVHPLCVSVELDPEYVGGRKFTVTLDDGTRREYGADRMTHVPGPCLDGLRGLGPITVARNSLGIALAGERGAARVFRNGGLFNTLVTPDEDIDEDEAKVIKESLSRRMSGPENAAEIVMINRKLKVSPYSMSMADAQFLESRIHQVEEIGRWFGLPPHLLGQTEKSTSWGTGIEEQNRGLARHTLMPWTSRVEQRLSRLVSNPKFVEFDYSGYLKPAPDDEINLLIAQVNSGLLTLNEARKVRNMPPLDDPSADLPRVPPGAIPPTEQGVTNGDTPEEVPADEPDQV